VVAAFAAIYIIWGSTYLAIRFAVETLPPFLLGGLRFAIAGAILLAYGAATRAARPPRDELRAAAIAGLFFFFGGNGALVWAQQRVASGLASLIIATMPVWMVLIDWLRPEGRRPSAGVLAGLAMGLVGIVLLIDPGGEATAGRVDLVGAAVLTLGSISWAAGSIFWSQAEHDGSSLHTNGVQMVAGGAALLLLGFVAGELNGFDIARTTARSWLGWGYLLVFGSLVGFTAYTYLLRVSSPARVATYAFVNPVVALALGWAVVGETVTVRTISAATIILVSVALTSAATAGRKAPRQANTPGRRRVG
jgi:drug/metabolite transporter (DMT)-like permease